MTRAKRIGALLTALVLTLALCAGCTKPEPQTDPAGDDGVIPVSSVEELLEAIAPDTTIVIEPGTYDLGKTLGAIWLADGVNYNLNHAYVTVAECGSGAELKILGADGLTIRGGSPNRDDTVLLTDPRTATVISFHNCRNVTVENLTAGHTDLGTCSGDVIFLSGCRDVTFRNVDLFGCGVVGIRAESTNGILVEDSKIHDCDVGPFWYCECAGSLAFNNCALVDNNGGGALEDSPDGLLAFKNCTFGSWETNEWSYSGAATFDGCTFSEVDVWLGPEGEKFEIDALRHIPADAEVFNETIWDAVLIYDDSGRSMALPHWSGETEHSVQLEFLEGGTGHLYWYDGSSSSFDWALDSDYSGTIRNDQTLLSGTLSLYTDGRDTDGDGEGAVFLLLQINDETVWLNRTWY